MSDRPPKRPRHGGEKSLQDGPDRRNRKAEAGRDRDRRDNRRDDDDGREHRQYRARSAERQDRKRDADRRRDEEQSRKLGRDKDREKGRQRDRDDRPRDGEPRPKKGESVPAEISGVCFPRRLTLHLLDKGHNSRDRDPARDPERSASPRRSASPSRGKAHDREPNVPRRPKKEKASTPSAPLSFKMGAQDGEQSRGRDREQDSGAASHNTQEEAVSRGKRDDTAMDEDDQDDDDVVVMDDDMEAMKAIMGFGSFGTTKNTKVTGNNIGAVRKEKKTEYRQYMNRVGGFNRPLSPGH
ncbi:hypothetical protein QBC33DRAFT_541776 [Phialemonium atrogriseum]|uniref:U4/U6.U5 small nuclear ribonucleoprotein 27kDa protein domain-containing protein n=1 Tax=Phialemonium atrogriseum TaxID=1093897 RepID=A0AAJ0BX40_9PEZI|nr:uncharacterized protein QBC33DRAFT_541776 [Phialemonium atrogriseum]KAK1766085.1 hypothetical protein QBC33DRAFT_541776 [Phialemonium atrogriseum]